MGYPPNQWCSIPASQATRFKLQETIQAANPNFRETSRSEQKFQTLLEKKRTMSRRASFRRFHMYATQSEQLITHSQKGGSRGLTLRLKSKSDNNLAKRRKSSNIYKAKGLFFLRTLQEYYQFGAQVIISG